MVTVGSYWKRCSDGELFRVDHEVGKGVYYLSVVSSQGWTHYARASEKELRGLAVELVPR